ncbi:PREDICTED: receptor-like protein 12 isoform X2 [Tarenaya hassleriana]|uniref:receptor-like protein 12 isoform X2 n=1 Tax=Tarenaya hassleriana TaxID=28532 RepID=UPI00053C472B|nr:PREDICTED: receptor-like protein 12 isoform X2 [Tarenaya hassleriana]
MRGSIVVQTTLLCLFFSVSSFLIAFASPTTGLCLPDQRDALLEFKHLFRIQKQPRFLLAPYNLERDVTCYPKTNSWGNHSSDTDCCSWEGVTCHPKSGEVIGLDLSLSCLHGRFHSNGSLLVGLPRLRTLNLAFNHFSSSPIPSELGKLVGLTHLNLSFSYLSGRIPTELLQLPKLVSLDLSYNSLSPEKSFLSKLAQNLTHLGDLHLSYLNISAAIPQNLLNLSSLTSLSLDHCGLIGEFPGDILRMPSVRSVVLSDNEDLRGHLPDFYGNDSLVTLDLSHTSFSGGLSKSIGNLRHLRALSLGSCKFSGRIPSSIGNLSYLTTLDLRENEFTGEIPTSISNLVRLTTLAVHRNKLSGSFPLGILNLTKLSLIDIGGNEFTGSFPPNMSVLSNLKQFYAFRNSFVGDFPSSLLEIPSLAEIDLTGNQLNEFGNISATSELQVLGIGDNNFGGPIPMASIAKLVNLQRLDLSGWNTRGTALDVSPLYHLESLGELALSDLNTTTALDLSLFAPLQSLFGLVLSGNHVSTANTTLGSDFPPQLLYLYMSRCNITEFPVFLRTQRDLLALQLSNNKIKGQVPDWLWRLPGLTFINISHNSLSSFQGSSSQQFFPEAKFDTIDLSSNDFQGPLFIPSQYIAYLSGSNNNFTGEIPQSICALRFLKVLDLSHNNFDGSVPHCFGNLKSSPVVVNLRHNQLSGSLPDIFVDANQLRTLDLSHNRLEGKLPKSLINCSALEVLNLGSNRIKDTFPFWLASLQDLQVLALRSNEFHGEVYLPGISFGFPKLRVIDISNNHLSGTLPSDYFVGLAAISSMGSSDIPLESMVFDHGMHSEETSPSP